LTGAEEFYSDLLRDNEVINKRRITFEGREYLCAAYHPGKSNSVQTLVHVVVYAPSFFPYGVTRTSTSKTLFKKLYMQLIKKHASRRV